MQEMQKGMTGHIEKSSSDLIHAKLNTDRVVDN